MQSLIVPGRPGAQVYYQPSGLEGINVATTEADLQPLITGVYNKLFGGAELVIDGQFVDGNVVLTQPINLYSSFAVRFINTETVDLAMDASNVSLFSNPMQNILSELQVTIARSNAEINTLVRLEADSTAKNLKMKNIIWDPVTFSPTGAAHMVRADNGIRRLWFEDCALNPDLTATLTAETLLLLNTTAPTSLELNWYGQNAGELNVGTAAFMQTALTGFATQFKYGTFGGAALSLAGISWSATAPVVVSRQP